MKENRFDWKSKTKTKYMGVQTASPVCPCHHNSVCYQHILSPNSRNTTPCILSRPQEEENSWLRKLFPAVLLRDRRSSCIVQEMNTPTGQTRCDPEAPFRIQRFQLVALHRPVGKLSSAIQLRLEHIWSKSNPAQRTGMGLGLKRH